MSTLRYRLVTAGKLAVSSLVAHKLRSFLTLLGVIIGVASVVLVGAAIEGLGNYAEDSTSKAFGSETYMVAQIANVGRMTRKERADKLRKNHQLRNEDLAYLETTTGEQVNYSPYRQQPDDVKHGNQTIEAVSILGVSAKIAEIRDLVVVEGRFFNEQEEQARQQVAVIGQDVVRELFPAVVPVGQTVTVRGFVFTVVGVQEKLGSADGRSQDSAMYIPSTVFNRIYGPPKSLAIFARPKAGNGLTLADALDISRVALRTRFKARPGADDPFDTLTPDAIRAFVDSILGLVKAIVIPVTAISLVVGGIVVMNIMLVSVTERTKEIGLRKALGALRADIMLQFLMESVMMSAMGGLMGLGLGAGTAYILSMVLGVKLSVSPLYVLLAIVVSSAVGIVSGWYPASRAAKMEAVVALQSE